MLSVIPRFSRRGVRRLGLPALVLVLLALAALQSNQPPHLHHGATAGLYNEEHVLAALDSVTGDAPLPDPAPDVRIDISPDQALLAVPAGFSAPVARARASRAPPLV